MNKLWHIFLLYIVFFWYSPIVAQEFRITEVMYNPQRSTTSEWLEIKNTGNDIVVNDIQASTKKGQKVIKITDGSGNSTIYFDDTAIIRTGEVIVLVPAPSSLWDERRQVFMTTYPSYTGKVVRVASTFTLQQGDDQYTITIKNYEATSDIDAVSYFTSFGADGDGNSLHRVSNELRASAPTPGRDEITTSSEEVGTTTITTRPKTQKEVKEKEYVITTNPEYFFVNTPITFSKTIREEDDTYIDTSMSMWNFGNGTIGRGNTITYTYPQPGTYVVTTNITRRGKEIEVMKIIAVKESPITINIAENKVQLINTSSHIIDISLWRLVGATTYTFPTNTILAPRAQVHFIFDANPLSMYQLISSLQSVVSVYTPDTAIQNIKNEKTEKESPNDVILENTPQDSLFQKSDTPLTELEKNHKTSKAMLWVFVLIALIFIAFIPFLIEVYMQRKNNISRMAKKITISEKNNKEL